MAGGGSQTTLSNTGVPDWLRPQVEAATQAATNMYDSGAMSHVEGLSDAQQDAYKRKLALGQQGGMLDQLGVDSYQAAGAYRDAAQGKGLFGADALGDQITAMKDTIGDAQMAKLGQLQGNASMGANLGGARSQAMNAAALSKTAGDMASQQLANRQKQALSGAAGVLGSGSTIADQFGAGIKATEGVGSAMQQQKQNEADAAYQGISRLFGLYGAPAVGSKTEQVSSGGK